MEGTLELGMDDGGLRHRLGGRAVHAGDGLEVKLDGGTWLAGTYEWTFEADAPALLVIPVAGTAEPAALRLPAKARIRWPA